MNATSNFLAIALVVMIGYAGLWKRRAEKRLELAKTCIEILKNGRDAK